MTTCLLLYPWKISLNTQAALNASAPNFGFACTNAQQVDSFLNNSFTSFLHKYMIIWRGYNWDKIHVIADVQ